MRRSRCSLPPTPRRLRSARAPSCGARVPVKRSSTARSRTCSAASGRTCSIYVFQLHPLLATAKGEVHAHAPVVHWLRLRVLHARRRRGRRPMSPRRSTRRGGRTRRSCRGDGGHVRRLGARRRRRAGARRDRPPERRRERRATPPAAAAAPTAQLGEPRLRGGGGAVRARSSSSRTTACAFCGRCWAWCADGDAASSGDAAGCLEQWCGGRGSPTAQLRQRASLRSEVGAARLRGGGCCRRRCRRRRRSCGRTRCARSSSRGCRDERGGPVYRRMLVLWAATLTADLALVSTKSVRAAAGSARGGADTTPRWRRRLVGFLELMEDAFGWVTGCAWVRAPSSRLSALAQYPTPVVTLKDVGLALAGTLAGYAPSSRSAARRRSLALADDQRASREEVELFFFTRRHPAGADRLVLDRRAARPGDAALAQRRRPRPPHRPPLLLPLRPGPHVPAAALAPLLARRARRRWE